jgi:hypothetical protein
LTTTCICFCSYNTFSGLPPEVVKKMARKDLAEEVTLVQGAFYAFSDKIKSSWYNHEAVACRFGGCRQLWVSRQKLPSNSSRSLTAFKM